jgi:hypothetical protein
MGLQIPLPLGHPGWSCNLAPDHQVAFFPRITNHALDHASQLCCNVRAEWAHLGPCVVSTPALSNVGDKWYGLERCQGHTINNPMQFLFVEHGHLGRLPPAIGLQLVCRDPNRRHAIYDAVCAYWPAISKEGALARILQKDMKAGWGRARAMG